MTEHSKMIEEAREQQEFAEWTTQPKYLYMDTEDGVLITKYNDGRIRYDDHGKLTYSFPDGYQKDSFWERLQRHWGGR